ncbi:hypothetical protein MP228_007962 [Amoeboaphelidium protococcarum]|nr:hypothetical protein MP228_007962 [Amoeboaphelidium protococcarum]
MSNMWSIVRRRVYHFMLSYVLQMLPDKCSTPSWKMSIVLANAEIARLYER